MVIPDTVNTDQGRADSILVEDVLHFKPSMLLKYGVAMPSMFRARQNKHREVVVRDDRAVYTEYAILFYEYESKEAMMENIAKEYPHNRHGRDDGDDPMYFLLRDAIVGSRLEPKLPSEPIPPPDDDHDGVSDDLDKEPIGCFEFKQF